MKAFFINIYINIVNFINAKKIKAKERAAYEKEELRQYVIAVLLAPWDQETINKYSIELGIPNGTQYTLKVKLIRDNINLFTEDDLKQLMGFLNKHFK